MREIASYPAGVEALVDKGGVEALVAMAKQENTPNGLFKIEFVMREITQLGDAGVNKLIEAGGIEALVEMAKQENTPVGRASIAFVMDKIAQKGDAGVNKLIEAGGIEALVAMAQAGKIPQTDEQVLRCNGSNCKNRRCWSE